MLAAKSITIVMGILMQNHKCNEVENAFLGWPDFDFFIPGHWFSKARSDATWGSKGRKWGWVSLDGAASPSPPARDLGALWAPLAVSGAEPRPPNDFLYFKCSR